MKRPIIIICMFLLTMFMLSGCSDSSSRPAAVETQTEVQGQATPAPVQGGSDYQPALAAKPALPEDFDANNWEARQQIQAENQVDAAFIKSLNAFAYKTAAAILADAHENRNFAPLSLYYALALTAAGTAGHTKDEFQSLLGLDDMAALSSQSGKLYRLLYTNNDVTKLKLTNSLWLNEGFNVNDAYTAQAVNQFYAWIYKADFTDPASAVAAAKWIAENTNGAIEPQLTLKRDTMMLIINTIYFYDEWQEAFNKAETAADIFHKADGDAITVDFMQKPFGAKSYYKGEDFSRIELGLKGQGVMTLILPDQGVDINRFLTADDKLKAAFEDGTEDMAKIILKLPKFKFDSAFELVETLQKLGLHDAFGNKADFSVMSPEDGLYISNVIQQSRIGLDENGVEAAAYTMVTIAKASLPVELEKTVELKFDRPFIFGIKAANGVLLFIGVCDIPGSSSSAFMIFPVKNNR